MKLFPQSMGAWIRAGILVLVALCLFTYEFILPFIAMSGYEPQTGDIVFQSLPRNELINTIEGATHSPYSHCGVVLNRDGKWVVIQALGTVKYTSLYKWVCQGRWGSFVAYRLKPHLRHTIPSFVKELEKFAGLAYDFHYEMGDDAIYCSELIYKAYKKATGEELGRLVKLGDLDWQPFAEVITKYEGKLPLERIMITPKRPSEAPQLERSFAYGV